MNDNEIIDLPAVDNCPELEDHPEEVTDEQAVEGFVAYCAVDDLDDEDDGMRFE